MCSKKKCIFFFAYSKIRFSHEAAHIVLKGFVVMGLKLF